MPLTYQAYGSCILLLYRPEICWGKPIPPADMNSIVTLKASYQKQAVDTIIDGTTVILPLPEMHL